LGRDGTVEVDVRWRVSVEALLRRLDRAASARRADGPLVESPDIMHYRLSLTLAPTLDTMSAVRGPEPVENTPTETQVMKPQILTRASAVGLAAMVALSTGTAAVAQEARTLKFAHVFPASHWHWTESVKIFQEKVTKATNGKIQFQSYHAGQLGKEGVGMVTSGIADFAILVPSYEPAKLPLTSVAELPGLHTNSCEGTTKLWNIIKDGGALNNAEYKPQGIKILYAIVLAPYQVMTTGKKVTTLEEMAGLKIRANGAAMDKTVRALGATPVRVTSNELYDALTRGTVDGGFWPIGSTRNSGLEKIFKYTIQGPQLGGGSTVYGISQKVWDTLAPDVQAAMMKAGAETQQHLCSYLDSADTTEVEWLVKEMKFTPTKLPAAELNKWNERVAPIAADWAKDMDSTGRNGTAILKAYREAPTH
jgi:TRAP-type C4-dicarboxylate transport system substrate-binding protein